MKTAPLFVSLLTLAIMRFSPIDCKSQTITVSGKIVDSNGGTLFAVNDAFIFTINLVNPWTSNPGLGSYLYSASSASLACNGNIYNFSNSTAAGFSTQNYPRGNITGMNFDGGAPSVISRFHCELYSFYPNNPSITDAQGMVLSNVPFSQLIPQSYNVINDTVGGQYDFAITGYTFAKGIQGPLVVTSPSSGTFLAQPIRRLKRAVAVRAQ
ncbi:MAG: hypothetical protein ABI273_17850 [Lacunisphaera sp.]